MPPPSRGKVGRPPAYTTKERNQPAEKIPFFKSAPDLPSNIDDEIDYAERAMDRLVRDSYKKASARAKVKVLADNPDFSEQWQWVAMLDACPVCEDLDGEIFSAGADEPPLHPNCQCVISPIIDEQALQDALANLAD